MVDQDKIDNTIDEGRQALRPASRHLRVVRKTTQTVRKGARHAARGAKVVHHHVARSPHEYATSKWSWYRRWHQWRWHQAVHFSVMSLYIVLVGTVVFNAFNAPSYALSTWAQSDWSNGVGTDTSNQYSSSSNLDTATPNKLSLQASTNQLSNTSFDSNLNSWNGIANTQQTNQKYSGAGAAQITSGGVASTTFYPATSLSGDGYQLRSDAGDLNGDGRADLVIAAAGGMYVYLSNSDGTLGTKVFYAGFGGSNLYDIKIVDVDKDGDNDVVATINQTQSYFSVFYNNGSGTLSRTEYSFNSSPRYCVVDTIDIDNDGWPDLAFACYLNSSILYSLNNRSGGFPLGQATTALPRVVGSVQEIAIGDINGDGFSDISVLGYASVGVCDFQYALGTGGGLSTPQSYTYSGECGATANYSSGLTMGDYNGDGRADVAITRKTGTGGTATSNKNVVSVFYGTLAGSFTGQLDLDAPAGAGNGGAKMRTADLDGDGKPDIVMTSYQLATVSIFKSNGDGTFQTREDTTLGTSGVYGFAVGSFTGNGKLDIATGKYASGASTGNIISLLNRTIGDTITQSVDVGSTDEYQIGAYVRNLAGTAVTGTDASLFVDGQSIATSYTATSSSGWYKLTGVITGKNKKVGYGVVSKQGKTIYVDDAYLFKYSTSGVLTSAINDPGYRANWGSLTYTGTTLGSVTVKVRTSNDAAMSGAPAFSGCSTIATGVDISSNNCVTDGDRYVQYEVGLAIAAGDTPVLNSVGLTYDAFDVIKPDTNASNISMKKAVGGSDVANNGWTNGASPYFSWTAGQDNTGGSGILGYCAYLGTSDSADPRTTKGLLGTGTDSNASCPFIISGESLNLGTAGLLQTALTTSNSSYYLKLKAIDRAGNVFNDSTTDFQFRFDNAPPTNPAYISAPSQYINSKTATLTWPTSGNDAASDSNSGIAGMQYQIAATGWYGDAHSGSGTSDDLLADDGSYTTTSPAQPDEGHLNDGVNLVYLRTWDQAGNISTTPISTAIKINTSSAPSAPVGVGATPTTSSTNSFAFHWSQPAVFSGSGSNLVYCYTVNTIPSVGNCTFTRAGETALSAEPYATQPGENTFYVAAKDEAGNINYSNYASTSFYANTPAPGVPVSTDIADVSIKATNNWRLAITWEEPANAGAGISTYKVYRSTDQSNYAQVGSSSSTSYVDANLTQQTYYYKVRACDSANQCSAYGSAVHGLPTGKFTSPADATSSPVVSNVTTKRATISWSTDRASDSKIQIGTKSGTYSASEVGNSNQVTAHSIAIDNLAAGTTYYFAARWTDEDGNTGTSQEYTFKTSPAPLLKEVTTLTIGLSTATIQFTTKDAVKAQINFGKSDAFGGVKSVNTSNSESTYTLDLAGLDDGTKYLYRITLSDSEGGQYASSIFSFATPARPKISNLRFQPVPDKPTSTQQVTWSTNVATNSTVTYGKVGTSGTATQEQALKTEHVITIQNLEDDSEYFLVAEGRDANGNLASSDKQVFKTALDTRPPTISNISIEPSVRGTGLEARGQIVVSWNTDEPATSQVAFSEGSAAKEFNSKTSEDSQLTTEHLVIVSDLPPSKVYSILPISRDKALNTSSTDAQSAIVGRASDSVLNVVLNSLKKVFGF